jgi:O-antigen/teichoic acid export membrane protein
VESGFHSAALTSVLKFLGLLFIVNTFTRVPLSLLQRDLKFDARSKADIASQLTNSIVAVVLASCGFGVWSLVAGYLSMTIINSVMVWYYARWTPRFRFDKDIAIDMFHYGKYIFISGLLFFIYNNFDRIIVAKIISVEALGLYALAFNISSLIAQYVGSKVGDVLFPIYAKLQDDFYDLRMAYLRVLKGLLLVSLPFSVGLGFLGGDFLKLLFGTKWLAAIPVLQILAPLSITNIISSSIGSIFLGIKKPKINLISQIILIALYALLIVPFGVRYGVNGIACVVIFSAAISMIYGLVMVNNIIRLQWKDLLKYSKNPFCAATLMGIVLGVVQITRIAASIPVYFRFPLEAILGTAVYAVFIYKTETEYIRTLKTMLITKSPGNATFSPEAIG